MTNSFNFIDLFAGIGGFHYALDKIGGECVFVSEWDDVPAKLYELNHGMKPHGDITTVKASDIPAHDLIAAGFPCQAFSISGKQNGFSDPRGTLFFDIMRIAEYHRPKVLFLENVRNFAQHDNGKTILTVKNTMEKHGYHFYGKLFSASDFGVPQARERFIMVGLREDIDPNRSFMFPEGSKKLVSVNDILEKGADVSEYVINRKDITMDLTKLSSKKQNKTLRIGSVGAGRQGERIYDPNGHAITLSAFGGGVGAKTGLYYINGKVRKLTPRECARVQGFPDSFILPQSKNAAWQVFGNSVPVPLISAVAQSLRDQKFI